MSSLPTAIETDLDIKHMGPAEFYNRRSILYSPDFLPQTNNAYNSSPAMLKPDPDQHDNHNGEDMAAVRQQSLSTSTIHEPRWVHFEQQQNAELSHGAPRAFVPATVNSWFMQSLDPSTLSAVRHMPLLPLNASAAAASNSFPFNLPLYAPPVSRNYAPPVQFCRNWVPLAFTVPPMCGHAMGNLLIPPCNTQYTMPIDEDRVNRTQHGATAENFLPRCGDIGASKTERQVIHTIKREAEATVEQESSNKQIYQMDTMGNSKQGRPEDSKNRNKTCGTKRKSELEFTPRKRRKRSPLNSKSRKKKVEMGLNSNDEDEDVMKKEYVSMNDDEGGEAKRKIKNPTTGRKHTAIACVCCWVAKTRCGVQRPCERCVRLGKENKCVDRPAGSRKLQNIKKHRAIRK